MREIIFRGKAVESCEWVYGDLSFHKEGTTFIRSWEGTEDNLHYRSSRVEENTVGQFTGLYDKDGARIYEGDIVVAELWPGVHFLGVVVWREKDCAFSVRLSENNSTGVSTGYRVVGNIHDNPDMLERKA